MLKRHWRVAALVGWSLVIITTIVIAVLIANRVTLTSVAGQLESKLSPTKQQSIILVEQAEEVAKEPTVVTVKPADEIVEEPEATQTAEPTATETSEPKLTADNSIDSGEEITVETQWFSANVLTEVETIKKNPSGCNMPEEVCYVLDEAGVLGADNYDEAMANQSAIWTGGANHQIAQAATVGALVPEGSYLTAYASSFKIEGGGYTLVFPKCGENCAWGFLARGWFAETHVDRHVPIMISEYGAVGGMIYTRYPVPVEAGQFFSEDYYVAQAENALVFDNCGIGSEDCDTFMGAIFDYNDGSLTILRLEKGGEWEVIWTNVQN